MVEVEKFEAGVSKQMIISVKIKFYDIKLDKRWVESFNSFSKFL